ncbi:hypothetical protein [Mesorhizobium kowhaii]|uniref:Uncharacterized protein n=1 Tax=Mesorhizobium kowhaii TaxID=1300272 RepID=A0A2W7C2A5_9HYPH|nr:hypothetical protein [Mesorhizobium kowhaii]PZV36441.1 hypothetical protein B5V02_21930 [Mesorhizobium kowhaii]
MSDYTLVEAHSGPRWWDRDRDPFVSAAHFYKGPQASSLRSKPDKAARPKPVRSGRQEVSLTGKRLVIDSSKLQSAELREFLRARTGNRAVLPDFAWFEVYKQETVDAVLAFLSVIGDFPEQIIVLKSGGEIARQNSSFPSGIADMEQQDVAHLIRDMVDIMNGPRRGDPTVMKQLGDLWSTAAVNLVDMHEGAIDIVTSLPEMSEQMFSRHEVRIIRTNGRYTEEMFASIFGAAEQIWETLAEGYGVQWRSMVRNHTMRAYLFRYALGIVIYLLWWIRTGCPKLERVERIRNDLIDLSFAVYGTYYDGFLTSDRKAEWMFLNLSRALEAAGR